MKEKYEYRSADIELKEDKRVEGYALVFEQPTVLLKYDGVEYKEVIDRNALANADLTDVLLRYNHKDDYVLARTANGTLMLEVDEIGLKVSAVLADTTAGNDLYKLIQRGDVSKMSFSFLVKKDSYDAITHTRRILEIEKIQDVSAVDVPAYNTTSINARDYFTGQDEIKRQMLYIEALL